MLPLLRGLPPACYKLLGVFCQLHNGAMAELRQMCRAMQTVLTEDACGNQKKKNLKDIVWWELFV